MSSTPPFPPFFFPGTDVLDYKSQLLGETSSALGPYRQKLDQVLESQISGMSSRSDPSTSGRDDARYSRSADEDGYKMCGEASKTRDMNLLGLDVEYKGRDNTTPLNMVQKNGEYPPSYAPEAMRNLTQSKQKEQTSLYQDLGYYSPQARLSQQQLSHPALNPFPYQPLSTRQQTFNPLLPPYLGPLPFPFDPTREIAAAYSNIPKNYHLQSRLGLGPSSSLPQTHQDHDPSRSFMSTSYGLYNPPYSSSQMKLPSNSYLSAPLDAFSYPTNSYSQNPNYSLSNHPDMSTKYMSNAVKSHTIYAGATIPNNSGARTSEASVIDLTNSNSPEAQLSMDSHNDRVTSVPPPLVRESDIKPKENNIYGRDVRNRDYGYNYGKKAHGGAGNYFTPSNSSDSRPLMSFSSPHLHRPGYNEQPIYSSNMYEPTTNDLVRSKVTPSNIDPMLKPQWPPARYHTPSPHQYSLLENNKKSGSPALGFKSKPSLDLAFNYPEGGSTTKSDRPQSTIRYPTGNENGLPWAKKDESKLSEFEHKIMDSAREGKLSSNLLPMKYDKSGPLSVHPRGIAVHRKLPNKFSTPRSLPDYSVPDLSLTEKLLENTSGSISEQGRNTVIQSVTKMPANEEVSQYKDKFHSNQVTTGNSTSECGGSKNTDDSEEKMWKDVNGLNQSSPVREKISPSKLGRKRKLSKVMDGEQKPKRKYTKRSEIWKKKEAALMMKRQSLSTEDPKTTDVDTILCDQTTNSGEIATPEPEPGFEIAPEPATIEKNMRRQRKSGDMEEYLYGWFTDEEIENDDSSDEDYSCPAKVNKFKGVRASTKPRATRRMTSMKSDDASYMEENYSSDENYDQGKTGFPQKIHWKKENKLKSKTGKKIGRPKLARNSDTKSDESFCDDKVQNEEGNTENSYEIKAMENATDTKLSDVFGPDLEKIVECDKETPCVENDKEMPKEELKVENNKETPREELKVENIKETPREELKVENIKETPREELKVENIKETPREELKVENNKETPREELEVENDKEMPKEELNVEPVRKKRKYTRRLGEDGLPIKRAKRTKLKTDDGIPRIKRKYRKLKNLNRETALLKTDKDGIIAKNDCKIPSEISPALIELYTNSQVDDSENKKNDEELTSLRHDLQKANVEKSQDENPPCRRKLSTTPLPINNTSAVSAIPEDMMSNHKNTDLCTDYNMDSTNQTINLSQNSQTNCESVPKVEGASQINSEVPVKIKKKPGRKPGWRKYHALTPDDKTVSDTLPNGVKMLPIVKKKYKKPKGDGLPRFGMRKRGRRPKLKIPNSITICPTTENENEEQAQRPNTASPNQHRKYTLSKTGKKLGRPSTKNMNNILPVKIKQEPGSSVEDKSTKIDVVHKISEELQSQEYDYDFSSKLPLHNNIVDEDCQSPSMQDNEIASDPSSPLPCQSRPQTPLGLSTPIQQSPFPLHLKKICCNSAIGETQLHKAARNGLIENLHYYLETGTKANQSDNAGYTALHEACVHNHKEAATLLLQYGSDLNKHAEDGTRPLHDAVEYDHLEMTRLMLASGADPMLSKFSGRAIPNMIRSSKMGRFIHAYFNELQERTEEGTEHDKELEWKFSCSDVFDKQPTSHCYNVLDDPPECNIDEEFIDFELSDEFPVTTYLLQPDEESERSNYCLLDDYLKMTPKLNDNSIHVITISTEKFRNQIQESQVQSALFKKNSSVDLSGNVIELVAVDSNFNEATGNEVVRIDIFNESDIETNVRKEATNYKHSSSETKQALDIKNNEFDSFKENPENLTKEKCPTLTEPSVANDLESTTQLREMKEGNQCCNGNVITDCRQNEIEGDNTEQNSTSVNTKIDCQKEVFKPQEGESIQKECDHQTIKNITSESVNSTSVDPVK